MYYTRSHYSRDMQALHFMRRKMVVYAQQHSIKAAARKFEASRNTVRLWLRRYQADPSARLVNARPPSTNHPQKMSYGWQQTICDAVRLCLARSQRVIASRIRAKTHFPASTKTVLKILKQNGLWKTRHTRKVQKRNLRHVNDMLRFCEKIQVDIKFLTDIPELKLTMKRAGLPKYQITARDCATGALWIGYSKDKSTTTTTLFIEQVIDHLASYGVDPSTITIQTDNGTEFTAWYLSKRKTLFEKAIQQYGAAHVTIPPGACTYNSMVEASHRLIEDECYGDMYVPSYQSFFYDVTEYQKYFNIDRINRYRQGSPRMLLQKKHPDIDPRVLILEPIEVCSLLNRKKLNAWRSWDELTA